MGEETSARRKVASKKEYDSAFKDKAAALDRAHDIRKFEIELYWKRATYFWAFSAAALAGYLSISDSDDRTNTFIICCMGFLFSLSWYLVNRGSSYWQRNWEKHVDLLEDGTEGPLHKLVINRTYFRISDPTGPYRFSPARTNSMLSLVFLILWLALMARTALVGVVEVEFWKGALAVGALTAFAALQMVRKGRTGRSQDTKNVDFVMRDYY